MKQACFLGMAENDDDDGNNDDSDNYDNNDDNHKQLFWSDFVTVERGGAGVGWG